MVDWIVTTAKKLGKMVVRGATSVARRVTQWWRARKTFTASDRSSHALFFQGEGAAATLTVATSAKPVRDFLGAVATAATGSPDPAIRASYQSAVQLARAIDTIRNRVEGGPNPGDPRDVDELNQKMIQLGALLSPLIPLLYPTAGAAGGGGGTVPVAVGELIRVASANRIAIVSAITPAMVNFRYIRPGQRMVGAEGRSVNLFVTQFGSEYTKYVDDPRLLYMGPNPDLQTIGATIKNTMAGRGRYRPDSGGEILYNRDSQGRPLTGTRPPRWVNVRNCDLSHVVDAVSWWNSNGRLIGPQMPAVLQFMSDASNYELEPSSENRARGARIGARYLPPAV